MSRRQRGFKPKEKEQVKSPSEKADALKAGALLFKEGDEEQRAAIQIQSFSRMRLGKLELTRRAGEVWDKVWDEEMEAAYYFNNDTGESSWTKPTVLGGDDIPFTPRSALVVERLLEGERTEEESKLHRGRKEEEGEEEEEETPEERAEREMQEWRETFIAEFDLRGFLKSMSLLDYEDVLRETGFDDADAVLTLQEADLDAIGMMTGHKRKLLKAVRKLNDEMAEIGVLAMGGDPEAPRATKAALEEARKADEDPLAIVTPSPKEKRKKKGGRRNSLSRAFSPGSDLKLGGLASTASLDLSSLGKGESRMSTEGDEGDGDDSFVRESDMPTEEEIAIASIKLDTRFPGDGINFPQTGEVARVHYTVWFMDGTQFEDSRERGRPLQFKLGIGQVCRGFEIGLRQMSRGQRAQFTVPALLAYGEEGLFPAVPPNAPLKFEVQLIDFFDSNVELTPRDRFDRDIDGTPRTEFGED